MKRFVELIMSLIVTAAAYAIMHIIFVTDLFQWKSELPIYVPTGLAVFTGFIFYFINSFLKATFDNKVSFFLFDYFIQCLMIFPWLIT